MTRTDGGTWLGASSRWKIKVRVTITRKKNLRKQVLKADAHAAKRHFCKRNESQQADTDCGQKTQQYKPMGGDKDGGTHAGHLRAKGNFRLHAAWEIHVKKRRRQPGRALVARRGWNREHSIKPANRGIKSSNRQGKVRAPHE